MCRHFLTQYQSVHEYSEPSGSCQGIIKHSPGEKDDSAFFEKKEQYHRNVPMLPGGMAYCRHHELESAITLFHPAL
jgi:hypothetical protein